MKDAATLIGEGWSTDGVPDRMVPHCVTVYVMQDDLIDKHHVQLERDGRLLTKADAGAAWLPGEKGDYAW